MANSKLFSNLTINEYPNPCIEDEKLYEIKAEGDDGKKLCVVYNEDDAKNLLAFPKAIKFLFKIAKLIKDSCGVYRYSILGDEELTPWEETSISEELYDILKDVKYDRYELKPCPFCGGEATMIRGDTKLVQYVVKCDECGALSNWFDKEEKAVENWNRRA